MPPQTTLMLSPPLGGCEMVWGQQSSGPNKELGQDHYKISTELKQSQNRVRAKSRQNSWWAKWHLVVSWPSFGGHQGGHPLVPRLAPQQAAHPRLIAQQMQHGRFLPLGVPTAALAHLPHRQAHAAHGCGVVWARWAMRWGMWGLLSPMFGLGSMQATHGRGCPPPPAPQAPLQPIGRVAPGWHG